MGLQKGDKVKVKQSVQTPKYGWGSVTHESVGVLTSIDGSSATIDFPEQSGWTADADELEVVGQPKTTQAAPATTFKSGDRVKVKASVTNPKNGWGNVSRTSVGLVKKANKFEVIVDFPEQSDWPGIPSELEVVINPKATQQQKKPKPGARKKHEGAVVKPDLTTVLCTSMKDGPVTVGSSSEILITVGKDSNEEPLSVSVRGPMMPGPMEITDNEDGTLSIWFTCRTIGKYEFDLCWGPVALKESPFVIEVVNMVLNDASKVTIDPAPTEGVIDVQIPLNITVAAGAGAGPPVITHVSGPAEPTIDPGTGVVAGKFFGNVTYSKAGTYKLQILWGEGGSNIPGSPFEIKVEASKS